MLVLVVVQLHQSIKTMALLMVQLFQGMHQGQFLHSCIPAKMLMMPQVSVMQNELAL
jgi:hypothetical protein